MHDKIDDLKVLVTQHIETKNLPVKLGQMFVKETFSPLSHENDQSFLLAAQLGELYSKCFELTKNQQDICFHLPE